MLWALCTEAKIGKRITDGEMVHHPSLLGRQIESRIRPLTKIMKERTSIKLGLSRNAKLCLLRPELVFAVADNRSAAVLVPLPSASIQS